MEPSPRSRPRGQYFRRGYHSARRLSPARPQGDRTLTAMFLLQASGGTDVPGILALCAALSLGVFAYIFYLPSAVASAPEKTRLAYLRERKESIYDNLRDLNF